MARVLLDVETDAFFNGQITVKTEATELIGYVGQVEVGCHLAYVQMFGASLGVQVVGTYWERPSDTTADVDGVTPQALWDSLVGATVGSVAMILYSAWVSVPSPVEGSLDPGETQARFYATAYNYGSEEAPAPGWLTDLGEIRGDYSLGFENLSLSRDVTINPPPQRGHMHPVDVSTADAWVAGPGFTLRASFLGMSVAVDLSGSYPEGHTFNDEYLIDSWRLGYGMEYRGDIQEATPYGLITLQGSGDYPINLSALNAQAHYDWKGPEVRARARGTGGGWSILADRYLRTPSAGDTPPLQWAGASGPPIIYGYGGSVHKFDRGPDFTEAVDPLVNDGFTGGAVSLSSLIARGITADVTDHTWPNQIGAMPSPFKASSVFSPAIDPAWAKAQWVYPFDAQPTADDKVATMDDLYLLPRVPGVRAPNADPWLEGAITLTHLPQVDLLPLVAREDPEAAPFTLQGLEATGDPYVWTLPAGEVAGSVSYTPRTRFWDRLDLIPQQGTAKLWEWIWKLTAQAAGVVDTADEPTFAEDPFSWKDYSFLRLRLDKPSSLQLDLTLRVAYSTIVVSDPHYTSGYFRTAEWEYTRQQGTVNYTFTIPAGKAEMVVDLMTPDGGSPPLLYVVDQVTLSGFANKGAEAAEITLSDLALVQDVGWDHTGRRRRPAAVISESRVEVKAVETWNYMADWLCLSAVVDGNLRVVELPDEPAKSQGERGLGYIQRVEHSPYSTATGLLHYARPLDALGYLAMGQGWTLDLDEAALDAYLQGPGVDGSTVQMVSPFLYWITPPTRERAGSSPAGQINLRAALTCRSWGMVHGTPYVCNLSKVIGGEGHGLLKTENRLQRITSHEITPNPLVVVWVRYTYKRKTDPTESAGAGEEAISSPPGLPAGGTWTLHYTEAVATRLEPLGVLSTRPLGPHRTKVPHPTEAEAFAEVEYLAHLWETPSAYLGYDPNDLDPESGTGYAALKADPAFLHEVTLSPVRTRQWYASPWYRTPRPGESLDAKLSTWGKVVLVRHSDLLFPHEEPDPDAPGILVTEWTPHLDGGLSPEAVKGIPSADYHSPAVVPLPDGALVVVVEHWGEGRLYCLRVEATGKDPQTVATLDGYTHPTAVYNPGTGGILVSCVREEDGVVVVCDLDQDGFGPVVEVGDGDQTTHPIVPLPTGALTLLRVKDSVIRAHTSSDNGATWALATE